MTASSGLFHLRRRGLTNVAAFAFSILAAAVVAHYFTKNWGGRMALNQPFPYGNSHMADFKDAVYLPARNFLYSRVDPYDWQKFVAAHPNSQGYSPYTPSHLWVAALFAWMSWSAATAAWCILIAVSISAMGAISGDRALRLIRPNAPTAARIAAAAAAVIGVWIWRPAYDAAVYGQPSGFYGPVAAILSLSVFAVGARRRPQSDVATGLWTAIALCKPQLGLQVAVAESAVRRWRALAIGAGIAGVLSVLAVARLAGGVTQVPSWLVRLPGHVSAAPSRLDPRYGTGWVDVSAGLHRVGLDGGVLSLLGPLLAVVLLGVGLWAIGLSRRAARPWLGALTLTLADLIAIPDYRYDELVLYPMLLMAAAETWRNRGEPATRAITLLLVLVAASGLIPNQLFTFGRWDGAVAGAMLLAAFAVAISIITVYARALATEAVPARV